MGLGDGMYGHGAAMFGGAWVCVKRVVMLV